MDISNATAELFSALSKAQGEIENATKNTTNSHYRSSYADLAEVLNTIRPIFANNGLSLTQSPEFDGSMVSVTTVLAHSSGGYIIGVASCVPAKTDAQGIGAATTYLRRYSAAGLAGISQEDDDGQSAAHDGKPAPPKTRPARQSNSKQANKPSSATTDPIAQKIASFRTDLIAQGRQENIAPTTDHEATLWANNFIKAQAKALGLNLSETSTWSEDDADQLLKGVYEEYVLEVEAQRPKNPDNHDHIEGNN